MNNIVKIKSTMMLFLAYIFLIIVSGCCNTASSQKIYAYNELVHKQPSVNSKLVNSQLAQNDMLSNDRLVSDLNLLVTTLDGSIYSFRYSDGMLNWIVEQDSLFSTSQQLTQEGATALQIPSIDGSGDFFQYKDREIKKMPYNLFDIVRSSRLLSNSDDPDDNTLFVGSKVTTLLVVDPETGKVIKTLTQAGTWEENCSSFDMSDDPTLLFTRSDYKVIAVDPKSGKEQWNMTLGEYLPFISSKKQTTSSSEKDKDPLGWDGFIEVFPVNSRYKMLVKKQEAITRYSYWESLLVSPPVSIYAYSKSIGVLQKVDFIRKFSERQQFDMLPQPGSTTGDIVPYNPPILWDSHNGQVYIYKDLTKNDNNIISVDEQARQITDGGQSINNSKNTLPSNGQSLYEMLESNQVKIGIVVFVSASICFKIYSYIKKWYGKSKTSNGNASKKTPSKKQKKKQQQQQQQQQQAQQKKEVEELELEEEEVDEIEVVENINLINQAVDQAEESEKIIITKRLLLDNGNTRVGKIEMTANVLGTGSCGTIVYEGYLEGRKVAIKRMLKQFIKFADREVALLLHSDEHMNVVRYHAKEEDSEFIYLALSFCKQSLDGLVDSKTLSDYKTIQINPQMKRMIVDLLAGLAHLHSINIVHRDIKPQNILVDPNNRVKISDMGLGKKLDAESHSLTFTSDSYGWQPAEYLNGSNKSTKKVDIFSMGCVIYYLVTGTNPFGGRFSREKNVIKGKYDIDAIQHIPDLYNLVHTMIQSDPEKRPTIEECQNHPFLWDTHKQMSFLVSASDYLEFEKPTSPLIIELDTLSEEVIGGSLPVGQNEWWSKLDQLLIDNIGRYRKYNGKSLRDLLRVIRNKFNHYRDLPENVQHCLGTIPNGFLEYFKQKFPKLIICAYLFIKKNLKEEAYFKQYFIDTVDATTK